MRKKKWTSKATNRAMAARRHIGMAYAALISLAKELEGRPASVGVGSEDVLEGLPRGLSKARKQVGEFLRTYRD